MDIFFPKLGSGAGRGWAAPDMNPQGVLQHRLLTWAFLSRAPGDGAARGPQSLGDPGDCQAFLKGFPGLAGPVVMPGFHQGLFSLRWHLAFEWLECLW